MIRTLRPEERAEARERPELQTRAERTMKLYRGDGIDEADYRATKAEITRRMRAYLANLPRAWEDATQEQRNRQLKVVLEAVGGANEKVVDIRPRPEFQPLFAVSLDASGTGDPDGSRGPYAADRGRR